MPKMGSSWLVTFALVLTVWLPSKGEASNNTEISNKIFGGVKAKKEYKFTAWIKRGDTRICGGSLYRIRYVIAAASCFDEYFDDDTIYRVILGDFNTDKDDGQQQIRVCNVKIHPNYDKASRRNNVALIRLERSADTARDSIELVPRVQFEPYNFDILQNADCYLTGYGEDAQGNIVMKRQKLRVNMLPDSDCSNIADYDDPNNLCYIADAEGGPCKRDDGSPISCILDDKVTQVGIHSFEPDGCIPVPLPGKQVAMDIQKYRRFIKSMIRDFNSGYFNCDARVERKKGCGPEGNAFMMGFIFPDPDPSNPVIYITAKEDTEITLDAHPTILALLTQLVYPVSAATGLKIVLPTDLYSKDKGKNVLAIRLHAPKEVFVSIAYEPQAIGATYVIPEDCLKKSKTKYLVSSWPGYHNTLMVVAIQDGTSVTLENPHGDDVQFDLDKYHTYYKETHEITGIIVHATAPVAVFAGLKCAYIPEHVNYCDTIFEMMPPMHSLTKIFVVPRLLPRQQFILRIVSFNDDTDIVMRNADGSFLQMETRNKGQFWQTHILTKPAVSVTSNKPVLCSLYDTGGTVDLKDVGDPAFVVLPGTLEFAYYYKLYATGTAGQHRVVIIIAAAADISGLTLNGNSVVADFTTEIVTIPSDTSYKVIYKDMPVGVNTIQNTGPDKFGVIQYLLEFYRETALAPRSISFEPPIGP